MKISNQCGYIGRMQQPLQYPDTDNPTIFVMFDYHKYELDVILLTPGTYLHAYRAIKYFSPRSVKIFTPSIQIDFISDIYNLCKTVSQLVSTQWVFPDKAENFSFWSMQDVKDNYINHFDSHYSISYIKNSEVDEIYDIVARTPDVVNYFTLHLSEPKMSELYYNHEYDLIHVAATTPIYGGLTYQKAILKNNNYRNKFIPNSFTSVDEFYDFMKYSVPESICDISIGNDMSKGGSSNDSL